MARGAARAARARGVEDAGVEARLKLVEFLSACDDIDRLIERALEWLATHTGIRQGLCTALDNDRGRLSGVGGYGISPVRVQRFALDLDDRSDPLPGAFAEGRTIVIGEGKPRAQANRPPISTPYVAIPLPGGDRVGHVGQLLLHPHVARQKDVAWVVGVLGPRLGSLLAARGLLDSERRLHRERELLHTIINAVSDPILLTDADGRLLIANSRAEMLLASKEDESEGRRRAIALNNLLFSSTLSRSAFDGSAASRQEVLLVDPTEGSDLLFEVMSAPVTSPRESSGMEIVSVLRNVTDLRTATEQIEENFQRMRVVEAEVRAERDRLDLIIDSVADPILVTDPSGNLVMMNAPAERLFTAPGDAPGEAVTRVRSNDAHFTSFISNLFLSGSDLRRRGEVGLVDPLTGLPLPVEAISGKIVSEHGEVTAIVTILHDRTEEMEKARLYEELKRASEELERRVREATAELVKQNELLRRQHIQLEQASALKSQFLANMSHEFRTPLNAILGYTSMLLQGVSGEPNPSMRRNLARVDSNARHLLSIINDILDISRIEAGKMPLTIVEFKLADLMSEVMAELEPLIARSKLTVTSDLSPGLPAARSDRQKVKQIVLNLLTNALKFTSKGSVAVTATYGSVADELSIAVKDTGIGITVGDRATIFEDFRQADNSPTREYGGAGLGLSICRRLSMMLGGRITLDSIVGEGSTFTLFLPIKPRRR